MQARACGGLGAAHASMGAHAEAARWHESRLRHATAAGNNIISSNISKSFSQMSEARCLSFSNLQLS